MSLIDLTTLRLSILLTAIVCVLALLTVWRINRHLQGVLQMMLGVTFNLCAFLAGLASALGLISAATSIWLTNMFSVAALFVLTEGILRFRGHLSENRWKLLLPLLVIAGVVTWWNLDDAIRRYLVHDSYAVMMLLAGALVMVWGTRSALEFRTYGLASLFSILMAAGFSARWLAAWQSQSRELANFDTANALLYIGVLMYMVGLSFALVAACYLKSHQSVLQLASEDPLTGLPNRRSIDEALKRQFSASLRQNKAFAAVMMDLNKFKVVNDTYGHAAGDALLSEVARRLLGFVRESDYVGRLGGDEFLLILTDVVDSSSARAATERLKAHMNGPVRLKGHDLTIDISLGVAIWPRDADSVDGLLRVADQRMYQDKPLAASAGVQPLQA